MRQRNQRASSSFKPAGDAAPLGGEAQEHSQPARVDYHLLRRIQLATAQHPDGFYKMQPLASRVGSAAHAAEEEAAELEPEPDESGEPAERIVTLVSPWMTDEEKEPEDEDEVPVSPPRQGHEEAGQGFSKPETAPHAVRCPKVIVVDRPGKLSTALSTAAEGLLPEPEILKLDRSTEVVEIAETEDPDVIVFGPEEVTAAGLKRLALIHRAQPKIVILLSDNNKTWSAAQMAASGASDFLPANASKARLRTKLTAALRTAEQLRVESVVVTERVVVQESVPAVPAPAPAAAPAVPGRVFTVASASGGSGKTVIATNLAAYLARATGSKVLLIDLDLQFGEVAASLHLHPQRTIEDLLTDPEELSETLVEHSSGFKVLCAPMDPLAGEQIGPSDVQAILEVARRDFDFVVVDTPPNLNETCLVVFDQSEKLILTANMDVPSLKNMRRYVETLEKLEVGAAQSVLVVNRVDSGIGLDLKGVTQLFPQGFLAVLPAAKEVPWSTNLGVPILQASPRADISRQLAEGFAKLVPPSTSEPLPWMPAVHAGRRPGRLGLKKGKS